MKKSALFILVVFTVGLFSSCSVYKEPCEGVTIIQEQIQEKSLNS